MSEQEGRSTERLRRMAVEYEVSVSQARAEQIAARSIARASAPAPAYRRLIGVLAAVSVVLTGAAGLGLVADGSVPGDPLYRIDRAYEVIGAAIGVVDPVEERLQEAIVLADRGDREAAVMVAAEALEQINRRASTTVTVPSVPHTTAAPVAPVKPETTVASDTTTLAVPETAPEEAEQDPIEALRLAAESLLRSVRSAKENPAAADDVEEAVAALAAVVAAEPEGEEEDPTSTSSTTTTTEGATSTTDPGSTSTTEPGGSTTTTEPDEGSSTSTSSTSSTTSTTTSTSSTTTTVIILPPLR